MQRQVAFITGGGSGIGRATALAYAAKNVAVAVIDLADRGGLETVELIRRQSETPCCFLECDVTVGEEVRSAILETVDRFGAVNFAFNNAGVDGFPALTAEVTDENWDGVMSVNLRGVWVSMKYEILQMLKQGGGSIVNCSGTTGFVGEIGMAPLVASKHGVNGLTKTAALEYASSNIRINAVCPGMVQSKLVDRYLAEFPGHQGDLTAKVPLKRIATPEEVAKAVIWLNSSEASYITGDCLVIDGGRLA